MVNNINDSNIVNHNISIKEIEGGIFDSPSDFAITHCVSAHFKMSKGLAKEICLKYGNIRPHLISR